ncbi:MAG: hypothetical protein ACLQU3_20220 [Limisphaerales bacterium]
MQERRPPYKVATTPLLAPINPFPFPCPLPLQQVQPTVVVFVIARATTIY